MTARGASAPNSSLHVHVEQEGGVGANAERSLNAPNMFKYNF